MFAIAFLTSQLSDRHCLSFSGGFRERRRNAALRPPASRKWQASQGLNWLSTCAAIMSNTYRMAWVPALVTGGTALLAALVTAFFTVYTHRQAAQENKNRDKKLAKANESLEELKDRLTRQAAEESARRDYEYEARKRLYTQIQPLLFQLAELCNSSYERIVNLQRARVFRLLEPGSYVMLSTIYRLVSPLVIVRQIQRSLTTVDLGVDLTVRGQYLVAKEIARTLTCGQQLAEASPKLDYRWRTPAERQHIGVGELEMLVKLLTVRDADGVIHTMDYSDFQACYQNDDQARRVINYIQIRLAGANPLTKPVVWRTLVAQAYLQWIMMDMIEGSLSKPRSWEPPNAAFEFNWATRSPLPSGADAESARNAVLAYIVNRLQRKLDQGT
jgi:hypothetical protein